MKNQLSTEDIRQMMLQLSDHMISAETMLTNLDSAIGDGDLGILVSQTILCGQSGIDP